MLRCLVLLLNFCLPLSLALSAQLIPPRTAYDDFIDVIRTSDDCMILYQYKLFGLHQTNRTVHAATVQKDLWEKYLEMRHKGFPDDFIESVLSVYCQAKSYVPMALNLWKPSADLTGNFTWDLTTDAPENDFYQHAKEEEKVLLEHFEARKNIRKALDAATAKENKVLNLDSDIRQVCRVAAFILVISLAMSIHNFLRMFYAEEEEDLEDDYLIQRFGILGEVIQIVVLATCLTSILIYMNNDIPQ
ncbi:hypothetical protein GCK72_000947 [Caenorhabditis remanei]|uniref:Uncharacterized protein n=1 Tax=Caenorhabditis remanei TaxID=31234 RepID=A0A6A5HSE5_CAERE|nr:hypothetical protein GCK72_000947 [Caenorhabditis remanei]KAF1769133.1 hypothetical protein GCK72_000947 [Caenorhabditis remanei]